MAVGQWGDIITFEVSDKYLLTMRNGWKRKASGRWEAHDMHASKTKLEYSGYDADEVEMEIIISAEHGVRPRTQIYYLERAIRQARAEYLFLDGERFCWTKLVLKEVETVVEETLNDGKIARIVCKCKWLEYYE